MAITQDDVSRVARLARIALSDTEQARRIAAQQAEVRKAEDEEKTERAANRAAAVAAMEEVAAAPLSSIEPATHPAIACLEQHEN